MCMCTIWQYENARLSQKVSRYEQEIRLYIVMLDRKHDSHIWTHVFGTFDQYNLVITSSVTHFTFDNCESDDRRVLIAF